MQIIILFITLIRLYLNSSSDIIVLPSKSEAFPNILVESSYLKSAVIASNVGSISEIIIDNKTGFIFEPEDENEYYKYLRELVLNSDLRRIFGEEGFKYVTKKFSIAQKINRFIDIMNKDIQSS